MRRRAAWLLGVVLTAALSGTAAAQPVSETRHASGIALLPPIDLAAIVAAGPINEPLATAWSDARTLATEYHQVVFGYPWADRSTGELVISVLSDQGEAIAREWMKTGVLPHTKPSPFQPRRPEVPVRFRTVDRSVADLQRIMDEVTRPGVAGYTGETRIWSIGPDDEKNRLVAETDKVNDELLYALVATYGTEVVAVRVDPRSGPAMALTAGAGPWVAGSYSTIEIAAGLLIATAGLGVLWVRLRRRSVRRT